MCVLIACRAVHGPWQELPAVTVQCSTDAVTRYGRRLRFRVSLDGTCMARLRQIVTVVQIHAVHSLSALTNCTSAAHAWLALQV